MLLTHPQYQDMCMTLLTNQEWYQTVDVSVAGTFAEEFTKLLRGGLARGHIDEDTFNFLNISHPRIPTFYALPKMHKNILPPPGRPIVSGRESLTENASRFVDSVLLPHVTALPSFIKDTTDLLKQIEDITIPPDAYLVAIDIEC